MHTTSLFRKNYTTQGLYLGKPEAEAENISETQNLLTFFEDYLRIEDNINNGYFIISGRKGAGKSAYAGWLQEKAQKDDNLFCSMVKKNEFDLEVMIQKLSNNNIRFEALFEWIILVRIVKMIIDSNTGKYLNQYRALQNFYAKNSGLVNIDRYVIDEVLTNKEVNFSPLKKEFGFFSKYFGNKSIKAPFFNMISPLRDAVREMLSMDIYRELQFYVLFDDLDVKFKLSRENDKTMLMDLIRMAKRYNTEYLSNTSARVLLFVRDDICDRLEGVDCDNNKIFSSYEYRINWYEHDMALNSEKDIMLRKFINKRLRIGFSELGIPYNEEDPWQTFVQESPGQKSSFKYILDHTFYLPRDIISIFKNVGSKNMKLPLSHYDINILLKEYSRIKKKEVSDELVALYENEEREQIFAILEEINSGWDVSYSAVMDRLEQSHFGKTDFQNMLDYNLLVPVNEKGHFFYNYREQSMPKNYSDFTYRPPKILSLYFNTK